jgi:NAD(P)-dependent dehydrogenase (short-subunit alcohol dehydrogenase family)
LKKPAARWNKHMELNGKVALVTGGAKRLGQAIALKLAAAGANIALHYHTSAQEAALTAAEIGRLGVETITLQGNLAEVSQAERVVDEAAAKWGRLDILINNAAVFCHTSPGTVTEAQWNTLINTNLRGPFFCAQRAAGYMRQTGGGVIINFTDTGIYIAWAGFGPYLISKAGIEQMTYSLAKALAPTIRVNAIAPGPALLEEGHTAAEQEQFIERTLLKRLGGAEAITDAVLYLVKADFVTGVVLPVDGGQRWR